MTCAAIPLTSERSASSAKQPCVLDAGHLPPHRNRWWEWWDGQRPRILLGNWQRKMSETKEN
jgi:hypothetical protein